MSENKPMTITEFLEARIAEDEKLARDVLATVAPGEWENPTRWGNFYPEDVSFWDSQTPARVLAESAAKRATIKHAQHLAEDKDAYWAYREYAERNLLFLAAVYADHPDYQREWTP